MMTRRELFQLTVAALASSQAGLPAAVVDAVGNVPDWKPSFFTAQQVDTVMAVSECIIPRSDTPGANDAKVYRYMDLLLERGSEKDRTSFIEGLTVLEDKAQSRHQLTYAKCTAIQQADILDEMEKSNDRFFAQAKLLTVRIYINTPEGYKELNRFGVPGSYSSCKK